MDIHFTDSSSGQVFSVEDAIVQDPVRTVEALLRVIEDVECREDLSLEAKSSYSNFIRGMWIKLFFFYPALDAFKQGWVPNINEEKVINAACHDLYPVQDIEGAFYTYGGLCGIAALCIAFRRSDTLNSLWSDVSPERREWLVRNLSRGFRNEKNCWVDNFGRRWNENRPEKIHSAKRGCLGRHNRKMSAFEPEEKHPYPQREQDDERQIVRSDTYHNKQLGSNDRPQFSVSKPNNTGVSESYPALGTQNNFTLPTTEPNRGKKRKKATGRVHRETESTSRSSPRQLQTSAPFEIRTERTHISHFNLSSSSVTMATPDTLPVHQVAQSYVPYTIQYEVPRIRSSHLQGTCGLNCASSVTDGPSTRTELSSTPLPTIDSITISPGRDYQETQVLQPDRTLSFRAPERLPPYPPQRLRYVIPPSSPPLASNARDFLTPDDLARRGDWPTAAARVENRDGIRPESPLEPFPHHRDKPAIVGLCSIGPREKSKRRSSSAQQNLRGSEFFNEATGSSYLSTSPWQPVNTVPKSQVSVSSDRCKPPNKHNFIETDIENRNLDSINSAAKFWSPLSQQLRHKINHSATPAHERLRLPSTEICDSDCSLRGLPQDIAGSLSEDLSVTSLLVLVDALGASEILHDVLFAGLLPQKRWNDDGNWREIRLDDASLDKEVVNVFSSHDKLQDVISTCIRLGFLTKGVTAQGFIVYSVTARPGERILRVFNREELNLLALIFTTHICPQHDTKGITYV
jgi:hypothetical protein